MDVLTISGLSVAYGATTVVNDVSFRVPQGAVMGLLGPNGAGKSTVMKAALGLIPAAQGDVRFFGGSLESARKRVAYMPQAASVDWDYPITVEQVVAMGLYSELGWFKRPTAAHKRRVSDALERVGIGELAKRQISELSGGQRRRVFVARILVQAPELYFLDEPFAGVDAASEQVIRGVLQELKQGGASIVIVHHDLSTVEKMCDHVTILNRHVVSTGPVQEAFSKELIHEAFGLGLM
ncbi:metal ABC transporter ATP-binding protein [Corynebacterium felinum]|uniref:metal ABC transporter ATP-binding protein n=1 Tax=Corynebacterium felinum TaxID=131318 RepID=UPI0023F7D567|nr:metal ABC transporter ATP-binding protein [Corynebacterium felinum]MDF5820196.1 metal ABC transporter ATP-binding protein [Corynebacterium felinum]WJY93786.1 High-affinity zinc uptake system ATP-binding protein ZnuC [Corynebacterium felinum]